MDIRLVSGLSGFHACVTRVAGTDELGSGESAVSGETLLYARKDTDVRPTDHAPGSDSEAPARGGS